MQAVLEDIKNGSFAQRFIDDQDAGGPEFKELRAKGEQHPIEEHRPRAAQADGLGEVATTPTTSRAPPPADPPRRGARCPGLLTAPSAGDREQAEGAATARGPREQRLGGAGCARRANRHLVRRGLPVVLHRQAPAGDRARRLRARRRRRGRRGTPTSSTPAPRVSRPSRWPRRWAASTAAGRPPDAQMIDRVEAVAAEEGLVYRLHQAQRADTVDAHRLLHLALEESGAGRPGPAEGGAAGGVLHRGPQRRRPRRAARGRGRRRARPGRRRRGAREPTRTPPTSRPTSSRPTPSAPAVSRSSSSTEGTASPAPSRPRRSARCCAVPGPSASRASRWSAATTCCGPDGCSD